MLLDSICSTAGNLHYTKSNFLSLQDIHAFVQLLKVNPNLQVVKVSQIQKRIAMEDADNKTVKIFFAMLGFHKLPCELGLMGLDVTYDDACVLIRCRLDELVICAKRYLYSTARASFP